MKFSISLNGSKGYSRAHLIMTANLLAYQVKRKMHESTDANLLVLQITLGTHADFKLKNSSYLQYTWLTITLVSANIFSYKINIEV